MTMMLYHCWRCRPLTPAVLLALGDLSRRETNARCGVCGRALIRVPDGLVAAQTLSPVEQDRARRWRRAHWDIIAAERASLDVCQWRRLDFVRYCRAQDASLS